MQQAKMEPFDRSTQFENLAKLKDPDTDVGNPVVGAEAKKKELTGSLFREGRVFKPRKQLKLLTTISFRWPRKLLNDRVC